jgi:hypothetical protein
MSAATAGARGATARAAPAPVRRPTRAPARRPARRPPRVRRPARRRQASLPTRIVPFAFGRTAAAVSGIADTGIFVRLTRGRLWIGLLTVLLVGIVAINVFALSFGATASRLGRESDGIQRANSALRARLASKLSDLTVQREALQAGLVFPPPGSIRYVRTRPGDARIAARRLVHGDLVAGTAPAPPSVPSTTSTTATSAPTTTTTTPTTTTPTTTVTPTTTATTTATAPTTAVAPTATTPATTAATPPTTATSPTGAVTAP